MRNKEEFKALIEERAAAQRQTAILYARRRKIALRSAVAIVLGLIILPIAVRLTEQNLPSMEDAQSPKQTTQNESEPDNGLLDQLPTTKVPAPEGIQPGLPEDGDDEYPEEGEPTPPGESDPTNPAPPETLTFSSLAEIGQFLATANLPATEFPILTGEQTADEFRCTYYADRKELDAIYKINGIRYRFIYCYQPSEPHVYDGEPILTDLALGSASLDLYQGANCFVGSYESGTTAVRVVVYTTQAADVNLNQFTFQLLKSE